MEELYFPNYQRTRYLILNVADALFHVLIVARAAHQAVSIHAKVSALAVRVLAK